MVNTVAAATKSAPWQGSDGIITEASDATSNNDGVGFKGVCYIIHRKVCMLIIAHKKLFLCEDLTKPSFAIKITGTFRCSSIAILTFR